MDLFSKYKMEKAIEELHEMMDEYIGFVGVVAKQQFEYHKALVEAGFTAEQAFQLILAHGADAGKMLFKGGKEEC